MQRRTFLAGAAALALPSVARADKLTTLHLSAISGAIGFLPDDLMNSVREKVCLLLCPPKTWRCARMLALLSPEPTDLRRAGRATRRSSPDKSPSHSNSSSADRLASSLAAPLPRNSVTRSSRRRKSSPTISVSRAASKFKPVSRALISGFQSGMFNPLDSLDCLRED